jgi:RHH-type proline utilization regulon transcriptional repressor/proline dehydrogenase/delta 1-pyrroline-5-carboxylate dehydrogenase
VTAPADRRRTIGAVSETDADTAAAAITAAAAVFPAWSRRPVAGRAAILEYAADLIEAERAGLIARIVQEGGRSVPDALAEVREAADFCRYYARQARLQLAPRELPGPTGERNVLYTEGRGVFLCISPWNFPAAIFTGQIAAALVAGNTVVAKPARATPLTAMRIVELLHTAGIPAAVLNLLPGPSGAIAATLLAHPSLAGVAFTGSTATARHIARALAAREGPLVPFVAETGGLNAMVVDSSALPEQVVADAVRSAFDSAGQRCSALRVLCVQEEAAEHIETMLAGAIRELRVGAPLLLASDVGPVIDAATRETLLDHRERMESEARLIAEAPLPADTTHGHFVAPCAFAVDSIEQIGGEVFGPYLHVLRYRADRLDATVDAINATGYGLTFGVHSRIEATYRHVAERAGAGNVYINRDLIGAVVGVQPFGGRGLSGTGPKAGGPHYLTAFVHEKVVSENTAALGGNAALLAGD